MAAFIFPALLACCVNQESGQTDPPWIPTAGEVEMVHVQRMIGERGHEEDAGWRVQVDDRVSVTAILNVLSTFNNDYVTNLVPASPQQCSVAIMGTERLLALARVGEDWIAVVDDRHRAPDGYSLVERYRRLSESERSALEEVVGCRTV